MLGPLEVLEPAGPVALGGARQRHVLAVLLVRRGTMTDADLLIGQLWGDSPPPSAATSLQIAVSKLRKALGPERIRTRPGGYELQVDRGEVDADRFERRVEDGRASLARGEVAAGARLLRQALSEWRGDAFADLSGPEILEAEASRLTELRLGVIEDAMGAELARGRHGELIAELGDLVAAHPFRERLHAHLMLALYRAGRQADALAAYARLRDLLVEELGADPSAELVDLQQQILHQDPALAGAAARVPATRVPLPATRLIGREEELRKLESLLHDGARLVCLTGPGGVGKTRLMLALAQLLSAELGDELDEIASIDLSPLSDPELVVPTVANALGIVERGERALLDNLTDTVGARRLVLLLDNFEKVLRASSALATMLAACPGLRLVVTSRERLALRGEREFALAPLAAPALSQEHDVDVIAGYPAVGLFCERVRAVQPDFVLTEGNVTAVAELCHRLDGLPLALELAAARVKILSPAALLARLANDRRGVLSGGARDVPERHRALDTTIAWSYDSLDEQEKRILNACSVFAGGATIEAVEGVCDHFAGEDMLDRIGSLLDKSLLVRQNVDADVPRVTVLETVRAFTADRLHASGETSVMRARHAAYYADLVTGARTGLWDLDHDTWMATLDADIDNIRAALDWSLSNTVSPSSTVGAEAGARMCADLGKYWAFRGALAEGARWLTQAVARTAEETTAGAALRAWLADIELRQGRNTGWARRLPQTMDQLEHSDDRVAYCTGLALLSDLLFQQGRRAEAIAAATRAVSAAEPCGLPLLSCYTMAMLGVTLAEYGDPDQGMALLTDAAALVPAGSAEYFHLLVVGDLIWAKIQSGRHEEARDDLLSVLASDAEVTEHDLYHQVSFRTNYGWALLGIGENDQALTAFARAIRLAHRLGGVSDVAESLVGLGCAAIQLTIANLPGLAFDVAANQLAPTGTELLPYAAERQRDAIAQLGPGGISHDIQNIRTETPLEVAAMAEAALLRQS